MLVWINMVNWRHLLSKLRSECHFSLTASEAANSTIGLDKDGKLTEDEKNIVTPLRINDGVVTVANELDAQKGKLDAQKGELEAQKKILVN